MKPLPKMLYTAAQVRELDRRLIEEVGINGYRLMTRAGRAAFKHIQNQWPQARSLLIFCGSGNNGGDGFVIGRLAHEAGYAVSVYVLGNVNRQPDDAKRAQQDAVTAGVNIILNTDPPQEITHDLIVDAVLGTGLEREVKTEWQASFERINLSGKPVFSIDVPSGVCADTGRIWGNAIRATATISFIGLKRGMFTNNGPDYAGAIFFDSLGATEEVYRNIEGVERLTIDNLKYRFQKRAQNSHKGTYRHVLIIGGQKGMPGAVRLAAEAALRVGSGLVSVATHADNIAAITSARPEVICLPIAEAGALDQVLNRADVILMGPGLGTSDWAKSLFDRVNDIWRGPMVIDADALNLLAQTSSTIQSKLWVLTPHPGEAARLLKISSADIQNDRFNAAARIQSKFEGVCVLKGCGTLIADGKSLSLIHAGNPGMATAGVGDVLSGVIAGFLAQSDSIINETDFLVKAAVLTHSVAADLANHAGERGMIATDVIPMLRKVVNE